MAVDIEKKLAELEQQNDKLERQIEHLEETNQFLYMNFRLIRYLCLKYKSSPFEALDTIRKNVIDVCGKRLVEWKAKKHKKEVF